MELSLRAKTVLVTGASRGIGLSIARRFAEAGANVMLSSRKAEGLVEAAASLEGAGGAVAWQAAHAGRPADAEACVGATLERFGTLDVLVNNAATNPYHGPVLGIERSQAEKTLEVNLLGALAWSQAAHRAAMAERGGVIVNVSSVGALEPEPGIGWYNVTKAALVHLTRQLAWELAPVVRVNAVAPGLVRTRFSRQLWEGKEQVVADRIPMGRLGHPDDVAAAVLFLASDAASWITGQVLVVDGGATVVPSGAVADVGPGAGP
ncbi:MAG TPA: SDR family oxidoreductase [Acidimicrobiales bacterium]|nr:SDR family oxidoreductase [Acidimicrobiales bacterium]